MTRLTRSLPISSLQKVTTSPRSGTGSDTTYGRRQQTISDFDGTVVSIEPVGTKASWKTTLNRTNTTATVTSR